MVDLDFAEGILLQRQRGDCTLPSVSPKVQYLTPQIFFSSGKLATSLLPGWFGSAPRRAITFLARVAARHIAAAGTMF